MGNFHSETVATYVVDNQQVDVVLCWEGKEPEEDKGRFYDLYDSDGTCLNEGEPWYPDGDETPSEIDVRELLQKLSPSR